VAGRPGSPSPKELKGGKESKEPNGTEKVSDKKKERGKEEKGKKIFRWGRLLRTKKKSVAGRGGGSTEGKVSIPENF